MQDVQSRRKYLSIELAQPYFFTLLLFPTGGCTNDCGAEQGTQNKAGL
jgi:hypothetical protein